MSKKVIIFDCFEVLVYGLYSKGPISKIVEHRYGISAEAYAEKDNGECFEILCSLNRGEITELQYWQKVIDIAGWNVTPEEMFDAADEAINNLVPGMLDYLRELSERGYELYLISDVWSDLRDRILRIHPWFSKLFERCFFSCDLGMTKSMPGCFEKILDELCLNPSRAIFIDDYHVNVERAKNAGIHGIVFKDVDQLREELEVII